jgi:flagellar hook-associated protein 3 FlgL
MTQVESALGQASDLLQQARETVIAAGNGSYTDAERSTLAQQLRAIRAQLFDAANRGDGAGNYLFGGQGASTPPFVDAPGGVRYDGAQGQAQAATVDRLPLSADGKATWLAAPSGNGTFVTSVVTSTGTAVIDAGAVSNPANVPNPLPSYSVAFTVASGATSYTVVDGGGATVASGAYQAGTAIGFNGMSVSVKGQPAHGDSFGITPSSQSLSVFDALDRAASQLATPSRSTSQIAQANAFALRDIDASLGRVQLVRSQAGEALNRIDGVNARLADDALAAKTERSNAEDLDMVQAVSEFQKQQTSYSAALQSYAMVQRMSLFNYLNA